MGKARWFRHISESASVTTMIIPLAALKPPTKVIRGIRRESPASVMPKVKYSGETGLCSLIPAQRIGGIQRAIKNKIRGKPQLAGSSELGLVLSVNVIWYI